MERRDGVARRLKGPLVALVVTISVGTSGYVLIEGWSALDALYMVVTTITTVGFREVHPLSTEGRVFTMVVLLLGMGTIWYAITVGIGLILEGQLNRRWLQRRMERRVERLRGHFIVCGYGRVGQQVAATLARERRPFVVIDIDPTAVDAATRDGALTVEGNATEDATLHAAGIERARGLITAVATDADNIFVTLSARALRPELPIVARVNNDDAIPKLRRAGATQVVSPYAMAGQQMVLLSVRPAIVGFVETLLHGAESDLILEEVRVEAGSTLVGATVGEARERHAGGAILLAVQRAGRILAPPPQDLVFEPADLIAATGAAEQLRALERACLGTNED